MSRSARGGCAAMARRAASTRGTSTAAATLRLRLRARRILARLAMLRVGAANEPLAFAVVAARALQAADAVEASLVRATGDASGAAHESNTHALAALVPAVAIGIRVTLRAVVGSPIRLAADTGNCPRESTDEKQEASRTSMLRYDHSSFPKAKSDSLIRSGSGAVRQPVTPRLKSSARRVKCPAIRFRISTGPLTRKKSCKKKGRNGIKTTCSTPRQCGASCL